jgi:hypothetical protein
MSSPNTDPAAAVWAITAYFNPFHAPQRRANYRLFRERLALPLVTVELAHDAEFELDETDAEHLVKVRHGDVMWQKERLLNMALPALPSTCVVVVWVDADVIFSSFGWVSSIAEALTSHRLVQPFSRALLLPNPGAPNEPAIGGIVQESIGRALSEGLSVAEWMSEFGRTDARQLSLGFAWAARRELLDRHGFFDAAIIGGGDRALLCAALGAFDSLIQKHQMNRHQARRFLEWAEPFHADVRGSVGYTEGELRHLWHGELRSRGYGPRHADLAKLDFNPDEDIKVGIDGAWRWNTEKPQLRELLLKYFLSRSAAEG